MAKLRRSGGRGAGGRRTLEPGTYDAVIDECYLGESKNGNEMVTVEFLVGERERKIRYWAVVDTWRIDELIEATGEDDTDNMIGKRVRVDLIIDHWNGRESNKVEHVLPPSRERRDDRRDRSRDGYERRYDQPQSGGEDYDDCPF